MKLNSKGQSVVEAVLIMVILLGISTVVASTFRSNEYISNIVSGPWQNLAGMIQNGAWAPPESSMQLHPNNNARHRSTRGEGPQ